MIVKPLIKREVISLTNQAKIITILAVPKDKSLQNTTKVLQNTSKL